VFVRRKGKGQFVKGQESSFCEQKEAKKLCQFSDAQVDGMCVPDLLNKSFLLLFSKKDASSFASTY